MRRRIVNILCILSLLLGVAAIVRRATISADDTKIAETVRFGRLWTIECDSDHVWAAVLHPPYVTITADLDRQLWAGLHRFAGFAIEHCPAKEQSVYVFSMPWWGAISIPLLLPVIVGFRRYVHRTKIGHCPKCRYDLTGNESGVCPECGTAILTVPR